MPIYEYKCDKCDIVFSELRKISERKAPISCPQCGGEAQVMISSFARVSGSEPGCPVADNCSQGFT